MHQFQGPGKRKRKIKTSSMIVGYRRNDGDGGPRRKDRLGASPRPKKWKAARETGRLRCIRERRMEKDANLRAGSHRSASGQDGSGEVRGDGVSPRREASSPDEMESCFRHPFSARNMPKSALHGGLWSGRTPSRAQPRSFPPFVPTGFPRPTPPGPLAAHPAPPRRPGFVHLRLAAVHTSLTNDALPPERRPAPGRCAKTRAVVGILLDHLVTMFYLPANMAAPARICNATTPA